VSQRDIWDCKREKEEKRGAKYHEGRKRNVVQRKARATPAKKKTRIKGGGKRRGENARNIERGSGYIDELFFREGTHAEGKISAATCRTPSSGQKNNTKEKGFLAAISASTSTHGGAAEINKKGKLQDTEKRIEKTVGGQKKQIQSKNVGDVCEINKATSWVPGTCTWKKVEKRE